MIYVVATTDIKPEHREAYIAGAKKAIAETRKEKGCIYYDCHSSVADPNRFVFVERWETPSRYLQPCIDTGHRRSVSPGLHRPCR